MICLNVGCGSNIKKGYVNIDLYPKHDSVIKADISSTGYKENTVDKVFCSHVIEHVPKTHFIKALQHWHKILKPKGTVEILCPNAIIYLKELTCAMKSGMIPTEWHIKNVLGWDDKGGGMYNRNLFSLKSLGNYVTDAGFKILELREQETRVKNVNHIEYRKNGDLYCLAQAEK